MICYYYRACTNQQDFMGYLSRIIFALLLLFSNWALASNIDAIEQYKSKIAQLPQDESPATQAQRELFQQIVTVYQEAVDADRKAEQLKARLEEQPQLIATLEQQIQQPTPSVDQKALSRDDVDQLEQRHTLAKAKLLELEQKRSLLQKRINAADQTLISRRERLVELKQTPIADNENRTSELNEAQFARRNSRVSAIELELLTLPGENEIDRLTLDGLEREIQHQKTLITTLRTLIQDKRRADAEEAAGATLPADSSANQHPLLAALAEENKQLGQRLLWVNTKSEDAFGKRSELELKLSIVSQSYTTIQQHLQLSSQPVGTELRRFTRNLAKPIDTAETQKSINDLRVLNLEISNAFIESRKITARPPAALDEPQSKQYIALKQDKTELLQRLRESSARALDEVSQLLSVQEQINKQAELGRRLITQDLLWVPSIRPVSTNWFTEITQSVGPLLSMLAPKAQTPLFQEQSKWLPKLSALLALTILSATILRRYRRKSRKWGEQIGNVMHDRFGHTFNLVWMPIAIALPIVGLVWLVTKKVINQSAWVIPFESLGPLLAAITGAYLLMILWLSTPNGLLVSHLGVPEKLADTLRRLLHPLYWISTPLLSLLLLTDQSGAPEQSSGVGRLLFIGLALLLTFFWAALWKVAPQIDQATQRNAWWQNARLWLASMVGLHLAMIVGALLGYVFTGVAMMVILGVLVGILFTTFLFFKLGTRWLLIEERRLAFSRAKARRNEILEAREKNEDVPPLTENYIDLQTISEQARVLLKAATLIIFLSLVWLLLKNALPTLDVLDKVTLWSNDITTANGVIPETITLKNLLFGIATITLCIVAAYNLPGVFELLVLRHLTLSPGTSFAITTISKYLLIVISIIAGSSQLGLEWSKLQWLIAALGVGLGFGLQEIVANFVSGVIILFEKPIRIGDTVTIGGYSGTVTNIQMRATTIADWDRKEIIIPNKTFITDQLINWSLSDPITRVVLKVGLAYGSDTSHARELLLAAANQHERVLKDPAPEAYFLAFGASSLDMELRLYVNSLSDRLAVTHELNEIIDRQFKEAGLEIAFPQLDVHLYPQTQSPDTPSPKGA
ncbi:mechanosensitive ion channel [Neptunomonas marina]|uniref:Mechanosensitive ion channel n=2 Tax=Neptunomonas marina TaxID=1815562 RepID=A0A437QAW0_9GAMM|nr:mechanosensitive ion channel [Neptunomonas marina]